MQASGDGVRIPFGSAVEWLAALRQSQMLCVKEFRAIEKVFRDRPNLGLPSTRSTAVFLFGVIIQCHDLVADASDRS